jgi:hypothetical protein
MRIINDPVIGELEKQGMSWFTHLWIEKLQVDARVEFDYRPENSPNEKERLAFAKFTTNLEQLLEATEKALFHFLTTQLDHSEYDLEPPQHPSDVWTIVEDFMIYFDSRSFESVYIEFFCDFQWDEEHGLGIVFVDDIIGIGAETIHVSERHQYDLNGNLKALPSYWDGQI